MKRGLWWSSVCVLAYLFFVWQHPAGINRKLLGQIFCTVSCLSWLPLSWWGTRRLRRSHAMQSQLASPKQFASILFGWAMVFNGLGEISWFVMEFLQKREVPPASYADVMYLLSYPLTFWATLILPNKSLTRENRFRALMDGLIALGAFFTFTWYFRIGPALLETQTNLLERIVTTAYPVNDVVLAGTLLFLWMQCRDRASGVMVRYGILCYGSFIVTDLIYAFQTARGTYVEGGWLEAGWIAGYGFQGMMVLALRWSVLLRQADDKPRESESERAYALRTFLPYALLPAVVALLIWVSRHDGDGRLKMGVYLSACALLIVILLRQIVALLENRRLYHQVQADKARIERFAEEQKTLNAELRAMHEELEAHNLLLQSTQYEMEAQNHLLEEANTRLEALATTDGMTGLFNHRALQERLRAEMARATRSQSQTALLLLDVDKFKQYNDSYGHPAGDAALQQVAALLRESLREADYPARYGGEEFAVLLPDTDRVGAEQVAERIRAIVDTSSFAHRAVTVSIGVSVQQIVDTPADLISRADQALYAAKEQGRNRVAVNSEQ